MNFDGTKPKRFGNLITISKKELQDFIKNQTPIVKKGFDLELTKKDLVDLIKFKQPVQRKGYNILIENSIKDSEDNGGVDLILPRGEQKVLKAEEKDYDRGLLVKLLDDGGYSMKYWYETTDKPAPVEVLVDGKSIKKDAKVVEMKFHPKGYYDKVEENTMEEARGTCWVGYKQIGMKDKGGKKVPNCVKENVELYYEENGKGYGYTFEFITDKSLQEAEYQGRKVKLNKIMQGDQKKFKVYVKNPKGNVVKVNFGQGGDAKGGTMRIRKSNPGARKSFRARHNCDNPGPKHKARYWACRTW